MPSSELVKLHTELRNTAESLEGGQDVLEHVFVSSYEDLLSVESMRDGIWVVGVWPCWPDDSVRGGPKSEAKQVVT